MCSLTMSDDANITPRLIHASALLPGVGDRVIAADSVEVIATVEASDHIDQIVEGAESVVGAWGQVHVD